VVSATTPSPLEIPEGSAPPVLVAALGPVMLALAGRRTAGTVTWMTGIETVGAHITPTINEAARAAGRPPPAVAVSLPVVVTNDPEAAKERVDQAFAVYPTLPSYRAMMDREGAERPSDLGLVGSEEVVAGQLERLEAAGATDFVAAVVASGDERDRTFRLLAERTGP
jgi:alkanesulfonate monooxygenase SsuD/methylene tetrahydromethanopterin reductase-like flavin-dependent oxidoreductase (luciferase family)